MPCYAITLATKENFRAYQTWLFNLNRAQQALRKNIADLETFEHDVTSAFTQIKREIESLEAEYRTAIQSLKQSTAELVEYAVWETTNQALSQEPQYTCPLSKWVLWGADPANTDNLQVYSPSVRVGSREDVLNCIGVQVYARDSELPQFPISNNTWEGQVLSSSLSIVSIVPDNVPPIQPDISSSNVSSPVGISTKPSNCLQCGAKYSSEDEAYFCPEHCRCHRCVIEGLCDRTGTTCKLCHLPYQLGTIFLANRGHKRCHVCCIAVDIEEVEANAVCRLCDKCVTLRDERTWLGVKKAKGCCRIHQVNTFDIDKDLYTNLQAKKQLSKSACCQSATPSDTRLPCGHFVCAIHKEHLKFCRNCQNPRLDS